MKLLKSLLLCFLFFGLGNFKAQNKIFTEEHFKFYQGYKLVLTKKYLSRKPILDINIKNHIIKLRLLYDEKLNKDLQVYKNKYDPDYKDIVYKKRENVYYTSLFNLPDINAVFLNRGNLLSDEKISDEEKQKYNELFMEIAKQIPTETYIELSKLTDEIKKDKFALTVPYRFEIFQDLFDENQRKRIDIINFLLWNVE